jgi:hypothetical protein
MENDRRQLNRIDANVAKPPAALFDIASLPYTGPATLLEKGLNAVDLARWGRAAGIYDPDVTSVTIPGAGSITPFYDRLRKAEADSQPLTEAQLLERLKAGEATRTRAAEAERTKNVEASQKQGYADWQLDAKGKPVRGLINNNPGNIRPSKDYKWNGATGEAGGFVEFASPEAGIRAMTLNLLSYNQQGINTVQGIISRWAPESDKNKTGAYINQVSQALGVKPTDQLNVQDANVMRQLVSSIIKVENGKNPYDARTIDTGIALGFNRESPIVTASTGNAPAAAAKTQTVTQAVNTGTPTDVATAVVEAVKPAAGGTMYGGAALDPSAKNPVIQQTLQLRQTLQNQARLYASYGRGDLAMEAASKIQAIDLGLYKSQADIGLYEGATTGNFSRAMSVLSAFTGAPHQVLQRSDGKGFDLYINGKVAKAGLKGDQVEMLVRTQVDSEYRKQLAAVQAERGMEEYKSGLRMREETNKQVSTQTLQTAREVQLEIIKGNNELAKKKLEMAGFKAVSTGASDGKVTYSNGLGEFFVVDTVGKEIEVNGVKVTVGPQAQRVSGVDTRSIWSSVNAPQQVR